MKYDLVIRNGNVVDGSGRPRYLADVGITGDRISTIGRIPHKGVREIDAEGKIVAPGFIEVHSHMDAQVFWDALGESPIWHGVTTTIMGNCGFTLAPCRDSEKDLCLRNLERAEDISREAMLAGIEWRWETFAEYLDAVESVPKAINYASYVGHCALRSYVMGERCFTDAATENDLAAMRTELESALRAGAIGFSTNRSKHKTSDDRYVGSIIAKWDEIRELAGVMTKLGAGVFQIVPDNWGTAEERAQRQRELGDLAVQTGRPVTFIALNIPTQGDAWSEMLALTDETARRGGRMYPQIHSRQFHSILGFETQLPFDELPTWKRVRNGSLAEQRMAFTDPTIRRQLVDEALNGPYAEVVAGAEMRAPDWELLGVFDSPTGPYRSVAEIARERNTTPPDVILDLGIESNMKQFFVQPFANRDLRNVLDMMRHPNAIIGGSDSGAHVGQIIDSSIPTFLLAHWVRKEHEFTLEQAIRKLTFDPALTWGLIDRGLVAPGLIADLVVFDPKRVAPSMPSAHNDLPAGAQRLKVKATGIDASIVAGQVIVRHGEHTGAFPGRVIRGPLAAR